mgnify:CR=1 FL=1
MTKRWQFSLSSLFVLMTLIGVVAAFFSQGGNWWILAVLVIGDAILFCIIAGTGVNDEQQNRTQRSHQEKEITE